MLCSCLLNDDEKKIIIKIHSHKITIVNEKHDNDDDDDDDG